MNKKINLNEGGEGTWNIPRENQTNVLNEAQVEYAEGESPVEFDSSKIEVSDEAEARIGEFQMMKRLEAQMVGQKTLGAVLGGDEKEPM
ncbi:hypothetical protein IJI72_02550 [Candidatus Saccharibacteria bacterium]|nr:hypothetical protein [Candidatus Saccharibacteria bacterium]